MGSLNSSETCRSVPTAAARPHQHPIRGSLGRRRVSRARPAPALCLARTKGKLRVHRHGRRRRPRAIRRCSRAGSNNRSSLRRRLCTGRDRCLGRLGSTTACSIPSSGGRWRGRWLGVRTRALWWATRSRPRSSSATGSVATTFEASCVCGSRIARERSCG